MPVTDYAKFDALELSSDDEDEQTPRTRRAPAPPVNVDAATLVDRLAQAERLGEEVLTERRQMVELDRRRNQNREALAVFRRMDREAGSSRSGPGGPAAAKHWVCMGDLFVRRPQETARQLLEEDQRRIERELETLRRSVKRKSSELCELDPSM